MNRPAHIDDDTWLRWLGNIGKWPEGVRDLGEKYCGETCYRMKKAHCWIQSYYWTIPPEYLPTDETGVLAVVQMWVDLIQGKDSIFPGVIIKRVPVIEIERCDCGHWMPPTKEQGQIAEQKYNKAMVRARNGRMQ